MTIPARIEIYKLQRFLKAIVIFGGVVATTAFGQNSSNVNSLETIAVASSPITLPEAPSPNIGSVSHRSTGLEAWGTQASDDELSVKKLPLRFLSDDLYIVKSPASLRKADLLWLVPLAGASAAAFATDTKVMRDVVSRDPSFNQANSTSSDILRDSAVGVPVLLFSAGTLVHNERAREAGLLSGEAMIDAYVFDEAIKYVTLRERPNMDNARGRFFIGNAASDPSFISGHSIVTWSSAAVLAGEYSKPWQQAGIYTLASGVSLTRVLGQQHFPSDTLLGSAAGWLIGHYVYRAHHRHQHH